VILAGHYWEARVHRVATWDAEASGSSWMKVWYLLFARSSLLCYHLALGVIFDTISGRALDD